MSENDRRATDVISARDLMVRSTLVMILIAIALVALLTWQPS
jgi:hypothetical protein